MKKLTVGSLFSGAGLGDLGLEWAGFEHKWFCERDKYATKILNLRWPGTTVYDDVCTIEPDKVEPVDVLIGGFPCQDVSSAGKRKGIIKGETRSGLFYELIRCVRTLRPKYVIVENVSALLTDGLGVVLGELAESGYDAEWQTLSARMFGAPQLRERVFIVAYPSCESGPFAVFSKNGRKEVKRIKKEVWSHNRFIAEMVPANDEGLRAWKTELAESSLVRIANDDTKTLDRLKCIGNGIVPHCTYFIGRLIKEHYNRTQA